MKSSIQAIDTNPFSRSFRGLSDLFKYNKTWGIILVVLGVLLGGSRLITDSYSSATSSSSGGTDWSIGAGEVATIAIAVAGVFVLLTLAMVYINGILAYITWTTSRGKTAGVAESFSAVTKRFWTIAGVSVISELKIIGGLILFIVPGIRAALRYQMALMPVFDENLKAKEALRRIKDLTRNHLMEIFGLVTVSSIVPIIGTALQVGGNAVMYPELQAMSKTDGPLPKVHWLNYLGFILLAGFILLLVIGISLAENVL